MDVSFLQPQIFAKQKSMKIRKGNSYFLFLIKFYALSVRSVGHKCNVASTLDSCGELSLMLCASTGYTARKNLRSVGSVLTELVYIFVVDALNFIYAEGANLLAALSVGASVSLIVSHLINLQSWQHPHIGTAIMFE